MQCTFFIFLGWVKYHTCLTIASEITHTTCGVKGSCHYKKWAKSQTNQHNEKIQQGYNTLPQERF